MPFSGHPVTPELSQGKVFLLKSFGVAQCATDIYDPVGESPKVYRRVRDEIDAALPDLILYIIKRATDMKIAIGADPGGFELKAKFIKILPAKVLSTFLLPISTLIAQAAPEHPNILIILTDDQGRADYSGFGTKDIRTPNIDRLAREGVTFQNFLANSSVCSPTRAALLSGCHPDRVGVPGVIRKHESDSWGYLRPDAPLLPAVLRQAGYHTALIGKWHLGLESPNTPNERGFDFFHGFLGDMMDDYWSHLRQGVNFMRRNGETIAPEGHATDLFTSWACSYLEERSKAGKPFFLYLAYNAPHNPIQPPPDWLERVRKREPNASEKRCKLVALIEHLDAGIGRVLDTLDRTGLADRTLVIFSSDNGGVLGYGANNGPWRGTKGEVYEGGLRVPGVVRWPGHITPGTQTGRLTQTMDIFPSACEAAGVVPPGEIDGVSFLPALSGRAGEEKRGLYFVRREGERKFGGKTIEAYRLGDWKLVQNSPFAPAALYNLQADPMESTDLSGNEPETFEKLSKALRTQIQRGGQVPWQRPAP